MRGEIYYGPSLVVVLSYITLQLLFKDIIKVQKAYFSYYVGEKEPERPSRNTPKSRNHLTL
jgi:hypothetical protein